MSNAKTVLLVRTRLPRQVPDNSDATESSYFWAESVKQHFEANGWQVFDLAVDDAVRAKVEKFLQRPESYLFLFYGHGKEEQMRGQYGIAVIDLANLHLLKNQKVYAVACWTAKTLGQAAANIARYYLGYDKNIFVLSEPYADYLEKCVNKGILMMLDTSSCTIEQARQHIRDEYTHWINHLTDDAGTFNPQKIIIAAGLVRNRDALRLFGDRTATLTN